MTGAVLRAGVLMAPALVPHVARWVRTFPAPGAGSLSPDTVWWTVLAVCAVAITVSVGGRGLPSGCPVFRDPGNDGLEASRTPPCGQPHPPRRPTPFCLGRPVRSVDGTYPD
jgi:hypothetical protein